MPYRDLLRLPIWRRAFVVGALGMIAAGPLARAQTPEEDSASSAPALLPRQVARTTNDFWALATAFRESDLTYDIECDILYYNPEWNIMWVQTGEVGEYAAPGNRHLPIRSGDRVRFRGVVPGPVTNLSFENAELEVVGTARSQPVPTDVYALERGEYRNTGVTVSALVDHQEHIDNRHLRLVMSAEGRLLTATVMLDPTGTTNSLIDRRVEITGVFAPQMGPSGELAELQLLVPSDNAIKTIGYVDDSPRFDAPHQLTTDLVNMPSNRIVRLTGEVVEQKFGESLVLRDATGQVQVLTQQHRRFSPGETIEAVGRIDRQGATALLAEADLRSIEYSADRASNRPAAARWLLNLTARVREMPASEVPQGHQANLRGVITWSHADFPYFYLQDSSGGIRVQRSPDLPHFAPGTQVDVRGAVAAGPYSPMVHASQVLPIGTLAFPVAPTVTLNRALSGIEDGQWVAMSGFIFDVESDDEGAVLHLATDEGDFKVRVPGALPDGHYLHAVAQVRGVCHVNANANHQLQSVEMRLPDHTMIEVVEDPPLDPFDAPIVPIARLGMFNPDFSQTGFVKVAGTVLHHRPGEFLYLADGDDVLTVHARSGQVLPHGAKVEVIGRPTSQAGRLTLREGQARIIGTGELPAARPVAGTDDLAGLEGRRVAVSGRLLNILRVESNVRFTLQDGSMVVDAVMSENSTSRLPHALELGAEVRVRGTVVPATTTGATAAGYRVMVESPADVEVLSAPPWWTKDKVGAIFGTLLALMLLGVLWVRLLRRRVSEQTHQIKLQVQRERRLSEQLQRATRLESLGLLAGGIAHDFNNLLTVVLGNLSLLRLDTHAGTDADRSLNEAERAVGRAQQLTLQLLTFAKGGAPVRTAEDLPSLVQEVTNFALRGSPIRCVFDLAEDAWPAHVDKGQIGQVVQNLVINAMQAMPDAGTLHLRLTNVEHTAESSRPLPLPPGRYLCLQIRDTGCGIPEESLSRVFDPYFSTKQEGHGLGLATVYSIVRKHHGDIEVTSRVGVGTTFHIWLPAADSGVAPVARRHDEVMRFPGGQGQRVLIMDDEKDIRKVATKMIRRVGYEPVSAPDGESALAEFIDALNAGQPYSAVIVDLTVRGGMGGVDTLQELRLIDPDVPVIVSSGYSADKAMAAYRDHGFNGQIPKPYELQTVARVLHDVLQSGVALPTARD